MNYLKIEECEDRCAYLIEARNFGLGIYNEETKSFIGIRTKFRDSFLDDEYHWDTGAPHGTVKPIKKICKVPDNLIIKTSLGVVDSITGKPCDFDRPVKEGGKGWYLIETGERIKGFSMSKFNKDLFDWIQRMEEACHID